MDDDQVSLQRDKGVETSSGVATMPRTYNTSGTSPHDSENPDLLDEASRRTNPRSLLSSVGFGLLFVGLLLVVWSTAPDRKSQATSARLENPHELGLQEESIGAAQKRGELRGFQSELGGFQGDLGGFQGDLRGVQDDIGRVPGNLGRVPGDLGGFYGDPGGAQSDPGGAQGDLGGGQSEFKGELRGTQLEDNNEPKGGTEKDGGSHGTGANKQENFNNYPPYRQDIWMGPRQGGNHWQGYKDKSKGQIRGQGQIQGQDPWRNGYNSQGYKPGSYGNAKQPFYNGHQVFGPQQGNRNPFGQGNGFPGYYPGFNRGQMYPHQRSSQQIPSNYPGYGWNPPPEPPSQNSGYTVRDEGQGIGVQGAESKGVRVLGAESKDATVLGAEPKDAVVLGDESKDATVLGAEPKDATVLSAEPKDATVLGAEPKDATVLGAEPKDATVLGAEPKDAVVLGDESKDAKVLGAESKDAKVLGAESKDAVVQSAQSKDAVVQGVESKDAVVQPAEVQGAKDTKGFHIEVQARKLFTEPNGVQQQNSLLKQIIHPHPQLQLNEQPSQDSSKAMLELPPEHQEKYIVGSHNEAKSQPGVAGVEKIVEKLSELEQEKEQNQQQEPENTLDQISLQNSKQQIIPHVQNGASNGTSRTQLFQNASRGNNLQNYTTNNSVNNRNINTSPNKGEASSYKPKEPLVKLRINPEAIPVMVENWRLPHSYLKPQSQGKELITGPGGSVQNPELRKSKDRKVQASQWGRYQDHIHTDQEEEVQHQEAGDGELPKALILGCPETGADVYRSYLSGLNADIISLESELHFFEEDSVYQKGVDWYKEQLPAMTNKTQVLVDWGTELLPDPKAAKRVYKLNPGVKLLVIVRDPVQRLLAHHLARRKEGPGRARLEDILLDKESGKLKGSHPYLVFGQYSSLLSAWAEYFPLDRFLIQSVEGLARDPLGALREAERFLGAAGALTGAAHGVKQGDFMLDVNEGRMCPVTQSIKCVSLKINPVGAAGAKGAAEGAAEEASPATIQKLKHFYRSYNYKLFQVIGKDFEWDK